MQPDVVLLTEVGDGRDGVEGAVDGGAGRAVDKEGQVTFALVSDDEPLQLLRNHSPPKVKNALIKKVF